MNNDSMNPNFNMRIQSIIAFLILGFAGTTVAQGIDKMPTVVLLSMSAQHSDVFWPEGEDRITDELQLSDMEVISAESAGFEDVPKSQIQETLKKAAKIQDATAAIVAYKTSAENAHLFLYVMRIADDSDIYREYDIPLSDSQDETDIAAFKVAELVQVMADDMKDDPRSDSASQDQMATTVNPPQIPQPEARTPLSPKAKRALVFAISGAATIGIGAVCHVKRNTHRDNANNYSEGLRTAKDAGDYREGKAFQEVFEQEKSKARAFNAATVAGYSIGGALLATALGTLLALKQEKMTDNSSRAFHMRGTNIVWKF